MILLRLLVLAVCYHSASSFLVGIIQVPLPLTDCTLNVLYLPLLVCGGNSRCGSKSCSNGGACRDFIDKGVRKGYTCECPAGWYGANCHIEALSCGHIKQINIKAASGYYPLRVTVNGVVSIQQCYCDMDTDGGGWTLALQRVDGTLSFDRSWRDYEIGFSNSNGNHWFGLSNLNRYTSARRQELRVEIQDKYGKVAVEKWDNFKVGSASSYYKLESIGTRTFATCTYDSLAYHVGRKFSTPDADHDSDAGSCGARLKAGWWYGNCYYCNPTGIYGEDTGRGIVWQGYRGLEVSMPMIRFLIRDY